MPSLVNDAASFLPNVLLDTTFQKDGILFGSDPGESSKAKDRGCNIEWAVVDPRRYLMYVWGKPDNVDDFVDAAKGLNAPLVTNGSFNQYAKGRSSKWTFVKYGLAYIDYLKYHAGYRFPNGMADDLKALRKSFFTFHKVEGTVISTKEGINLVEPLQPDWGNAYFGRKSGRDFADYQIGAGQAPQIDEVIGGLFRSVENYVAVEKNNKDGDQLVGAGFFGLAPVTGDAANPVPAALTNANIGAAIATYSSKEPATALKILPALGGLIVVSFGWEQTQRMAEILAAVQVKDAARVDGNESILFGHGSTMTFGEGMNEYKRLYNKFGYRFAAG